jgi:hypothetical protein
LVWRAEEFHHPETFVYALLTAHQPVDKKSWKPFSTSKRSKGCSKRSSNKAAAEGKPEVHPLGHVEDFAEERTQ